jgi:hypothetical protein
LNEQHRKNFFSYGKQSLEVGCFYSGPSFLEASSKVVTQSHLSIFLKKKFNPLDDFSTVPDGNLNKNSSAIVFLKIFLPQKSIGHNGLNLLKCSTAKGLRNDKWFWHDKNA